MKLTKEQLKDLDNLFEYQKQRVKVNLAKALSSGAISEEDVKENFVGIVKAVMDITITANGIHSSRIKKDLEHFI